MRGPRNPAKILEIMQRRCIVICERDGRAINAQFYGGGYARLKSVMGLIDSGQIVLDHSESKDLRTFKFYYPKVYA